MLVGIHKCLNGRFPDYLERYETILDFNGIKHKRLDVDDLGFWDDVAECDLFIFRWNSKDSTKQRAKTIIPLVEHEMGVQCFPNMATCWHYDDKIRQHYLLSRYKFPVIDTWVFWDKKRALDWTEKATYPVIFKLSAGSASHNVLMVKTEEQARKLVRRMFGKGMISGQIGGLGDARFKDIKLTKIVRRKLSRFVKERRGEDASETWVPNKSYALFQAFLPGNKFDTRVVVIGDRAMAFRRFNRENDFRASGSNIKDLEPETIDKEFLQIAFDISKKLKFQCMAYDFLYGPDGHPRVVEMSYTFPDRTIPHCPGYWDSKFNWHPGHHWAQYFQLIDALGLPDMKQPHME
ncbi:MAG: hypothetical protein GY765_33150 [bacterium]|nr:hypothetical protein [bacterium]